MNLLRANLRESVIVFSAFPSKAELHEHMHKCTFLLLLLLLFLFLFFFLPPSLCDICVCLWGTEVDSLPCMWLFPRVLRIQTQAFTLVQKQITDYTSPESLDTELLWPSCYSFNGLVICWNCLHNSGKQLILLFIYRFIVIVMKNLWPTTRWRGHRVRCLG